MELALEPKNGLYRVPCGKGTGEIIVDLAGIAQAETRLQDVAHVNVQTAPELLSTFNKHWLDLRKNVTQLTYERNQAENVWKRTQADALLDCNDDKIKARGHAKGSQDLREAMMLLDQRVVDAKDRFDHIRAVLDYLTGKAEAFLNAYTSVKKICGTQNLPNGTIGDPGNSNPFGDDKTDDPIEESEPDMPEGFEDPSTYRRGR